VKRRWGAALLSGVLCFAVTYFAVLLMAAIAYEVQFYPLATLLVDLSLYLGLFYGIIYGLTKI